MIIDSLDNHFDGVIYLGSKDVYHDGVKPPTDYHRAKGWIEVQDKQDIKKDKSVNYTGIIYGNLREFITINILYRKTFYVGIEGFEGIGIISSLGNLILIGSASRFAIR